MNIPRYLLYEKKIHGILLNHSKNLNFKINPLIGGYSNRNDIQIIKDNIFCGIEIKSGPSSDYGQFTLKWNDSENHWDIKRKYAKHDIILQNYLSTICKSISFWNNQKLVLSHDYTYNDWNLIKRDFPEHYIQLPYYKSIGLDLDYIKAYYLFKKNYYIQIKNRGLFHFNDIYNLDTSPFTCNTKLRIRFKHYGKKCKETGKSIPSGIVASFRPLSLDIQSKYSLDHIDKIPDNL